MATSNVSILKDSGWVVVSSAAKVFATNQGSGIIEYCWNNSDPIEPFKPIILYPSYGVNRDFETGALRMRNNSPIDEIIVTVDEGV